MGRGEETRAAIVDHALRLASTVGLEQLTIGGLAKAMQLSKSGLFAHFQSKENLQITVIEAASELFVRHIIRPALLEPRGEPRIRGMFDRWLSWAESSTLPGGCPFVSASVEVDDKPGPLRDAVEKSQRDWLRTLSTAARMAVDERHFHERVDPELFAYQMHSLMLGHHHAHRLLKDPRAGDRARRAFEDLLDHCRAPN